jgi:hypothetical protein
MNSDLPMVATARRAMVDRKYRRSMTDQQRNEIDMYFSTLNYFQPRPLSMAPPERTPDLEAIGRFVMGGMM